ncbi:MAG: hypothetical protein HYY01_00515 [Chloroflexi bacterium]|nr:hypothetical protein [Chloroflexota bacterium]
MSLAEQGYRWLPLDQAWRSIPPLEAGAEVNRLYRGFTGTWCRYIMATTYTQQLQGVVALTHGPLSCVAATRNFKMTNYSLFWANPFLHTPCTAMDEMSCIMGGARQLEEAILAVDRDYRPPIILIFETCATSMIDDNIPHIIARIQPKVRARLVHFPSGGYASPWNGRSVELTAENYVQVMEPPARVGPDLVNILGFYKDAGCTQGRKYPGDATELSRLVGGLGLRVHRMLNSGDYDYVRTAPEAALNAINCPTWGYPLARQMEKQFGTHWLKQAMPCGLGSTARWLRGLAQATGRQEQAETLIAAEESRLRPTFEELARLCRGKVALIECGRNAQGSLARPLQYGRMLQELGVESYFYNLHPMELKARRDDVDCFVGDGYNPKVLVGPYPYQRPVNTPDVMRELGLDVDHVIYLWEDAFPYSRAGEFDPSDVPWVNTSVHFRRTKEGPFRSIGYAGTASLWHSIRESLQVGQRKARSTLYGRVYSRTPFDFQRSQHGPAGAP